VGEGSEVVTTAQTCVATNVGIVRRGAIPEFVDVDPQTGLVDVEDVKRNLSSKTKVIVSVDWGGHACDYEALRAFGIPVIEDAAHAVGTLYRGCHVAKSGGDYVCFSFQAIKHLTTGDGGALVVPAAEVNRAQMLRWFGLDRSRPAKFRFQQDIAELGYKFHMNDIAATIGSCNLRRLPWVLERHRWNAKTLSRMLTGVTGVDVPLMTDGSSWWLFTILVDRREEFIEKMEAEGVVCSPVHTRNDLMTGFLHARRSSRLSGLDDFARRHVAIPVGWWLTPTDLEIIAEKVEECA
jgi:dTDP-4-amino-4,6-dideoxygalactose transaminase